MNYCTSQGPTAADDPQRMIFYAICGFWADDWDKVARTGFDRTGIPCCPACRCVGFETTAAEWQHWVQAYEADGHFRYQEFLERYHHQCHRDEGAFEAAYKAWLKAQEFEP